MWPTHVIGVPQFQVLRCYQSAKRVSPPIRRQKQPARTPQLRTLRTHHVIQVPRQLRFLSDLWGKPRRHGAHRRHRGLGSNPGHSAGRQASLLSCVKGAHSRRQGADDGAQASASEHGQCRRTSASGSWGRHERLQTRLSLAPFLLLHPPPPPCLFTYDKPGAHQQNIF